METVLTGKLKKTSVAGYLQGNLIHLTSVTVKLGDPCPCKFEISS